jgi:hypothetical protein
MHPFEDPCEDPFEDPRTNSFDGGKPASCIVRTYTFLTMAFLMKKALLHQKSTEKYTETKKDELCAPLS